MRITAVVALLVSVLGSVAGFLQSGKCSNINTLMDMDYSLEEAMSLASGLTFPADCNYQQAFDSACSDAGLACYDYRTRPTPPNFATAEVAAITTYQQDVASYAECWGDDGAYRRTASCVADEDFIAAKDVMDDAQTDIEAAITEVQNQLLDATGAQAESLQAQLTALQSTQASVEEAITAVQRSMDYVPPSPSPSPAKPADLDGATVGTIVVASLIGVALVGGAIAVHLEV